MFVVIILVLVWVSVMHVVMCLFVDVCGLGLGMILYLSVNKVAHPGDGQTIQGTKMGK